LQTQAAVANNDHPTEGAFAHSINLGVAPGVERRQGARMPNDRKIGTTKDG
jgi:hypothetical protein